MTLKVSSARFGELDIEDAKVIAIPDGMVGFDEQRYVLLTPDGGGPFCWLQAADNPDLAFVVVDPTLFVPEYRIKITRDEYDRLQLGPEDEVILLAVVTMASDPRNITINLQGPVALNPERMIAKQLVMDEKYPSRHPLISAKPGDFSIGKGVVPASLGSLREGLGTPLNG